MNIVKAKDYGHMSEQACEVLINCLVKKPDAVICVATGSSPTGTYEKFVKRVKEENLDVSKLRIVKLDEWVGLEKEDPSTCEYYIREFLLEPLGISDDRYISFDPQACDEDAERQRISALLAEAGGIDCCVLGIGKNGHLGLNEPQDEIDPFIHKAVLDTKTQQHPMLENSPVKVTEGYTLGIKDILNAREILFLVTGNGKRESYENFMGKKLSSKYPSNYLWLHNNVTCFVDEDSL